MSVSGCVRSLGLISLISSACSASRQSSTTGDQGLYLKPPLECDISKRNRAGIYQDYSNGPVNTLQSLFEWKFSHVMRTCGFDPVIQDEPTFIRDKKQLI